MPCTIGVDFGTGSVRALVVNCADGREMGGCVVDYPSGEHGILLDPRDQHLARQHPGDYLFGLKSVIGALAEAAREPEFSKDDVIGIGVAATGSSPMPVDEKNVPLALDAQWGEHPAAQCWLPRDHTSHREAAEIKQLAAKHRPQFLAKCGNNYSSEWWWSKIWHCLRSSPDVFGAAYSWVELADWIPSVLAGVDDPLAVKRGICAAGHKALYCDDWGGLPDKEFLAMLDPKLAELRDRLYDKACDAAAPAGALGREWAYRLGLRAGIPIAIGEFDVQYGAVGCGVREGTLVKAIGASSRDCCVVSAERKVADIPGISGIVKGAILPGHYGIEAGQSAVGDLFKWWVLGVCRGDTNLHAELMREAAQLRPGQSGLLALDWNSGSRTIPVDPLLTGLLLGQTLHTTQAEIYRALIEATAFGARAIMERIGEYSVPMNRVVCAGALAEKNPLLMQIYADVTGCTMQLAGSPHASALGAAVSAAVLVRAHPDFPSAQSAMTSLRSEVFSPEPENHRIYDRLYALYRALHDAFGGMSSTADLTRVMRELIEIRQAQAH